MKIIFDIIHPADTLFFHHPIRILLSRGNDVTIASRANKDITLKILDEMAFSHSAISAAATSIPGMLLELGQRNLNLLRMARRIKPDVLVGFGSASAAHVGRILGVPSISFYDTEVARLQMALVTPFITEWHVPEVYTGPAPKNKTFRFNAPGQLSYFHPENFRPDFKRALAAGLDPTRPNIFMRRVAWNSNHDIGKSGWSDEQLSQLVEKLCEVGKVHISAEGRLPKELEALRYRGNVLDVHHLIAACDVTVSQSATMAAESALIGTPAVYAVDDYRGFIDELIAKGMVLPATGDTASLTAAVMSLFATGKTEWLDRRDSAISNYINVSTYVVDAIQRHKRDGNK